MKKITLIIFLLIIYLYICNITLLPNNIIILQGEDLKINTAFGISINKTNNYNIIQASSGNTNVVQTGKINYRLSLFDIFNVKDITVNVIPKTKVVPIGKAIGMKLYTQGVLVVGMSEIEGKKPYEKSGIKEGDMIIEINEREISNTQDLINNVNKSKGENINIKYVRNKDTISTSIKPVKTQKNEYKIGLWVRDAAAGVGTMTFYEPTTKTFGALGHGITDVDTQGLINIANGELVTTDIISISKGEKGKPGEIRGTIESGISVGKIYKNTGFGVYGIIENKNKLQIDENDAINVAIRNEIKTGKAEILCELENGKTEKYEIEKQRVYTANNEDNKSMLIKITDKRLIEKTGGIIQRNEWSSNNTK